MNNIVEFEAALMMALQQEEPLKLRLTLEGMGMPVDAQDTVIRASSELAADDFRGIARVIERHGLSPTAEQWLR
ncbi:hypothetical protein [uncultured Ferrimonas sp.]|uniref:hypothetical protein n=1 Tax=uncultured Ferrimonas sp. TaxID=432640 RepID=UPI0026292CED|nr:hypothetical protein [uncultured Ferrimonas sp.]